MPEKNDIMTLKEAARYLRLKPQAICSWAQGKELPAAKLGKEWRFRKSIVDEWFLEHIDKKRSGVIGRWKAKQEEQGN